MTAIVTGAGSGIGKATARRVAADGASVVCADLAKVDQTAREIVTDGGRAIAVELDVRNAVAWSAAVTRAEESFGPVDLLANIAGVVASGIDTATEQTEDEWDRVVGTNLKGSWLGMRAVLPSMLGRETGAIVNIASEAAIIGMPGVMSYTASKGGVSALTRQVAIEYAKRGVVVNAIAPGFIRTQLQEGLDPALLAGKLGEIPVGRFGVPDDIAACVAYLFSADAAYMTGQVVAVDGGWGVS